MALGEIFLFLGAGFVLWKASQLIVRGIDSFSGNLKISSFAASFIILGALTSLTEISVGINAILEKTPEVFVGNLIGGSFVILMFVVPLLAIFNRNITLHDHMEQKRLFFFLLLILAPSVTILDGSVNKYDALILIALWAVFFYIFQKGEHVMDNVSVRKLERKEVLVNLIKVAAGTILIFLASKVLVDLVIDFANAMSIAPFVVSLLILSVGTNLPEMVIAVNTIYNKKTDIAFGDYIGSAASNPLLFGIFSLVHGPFSVSAAGFNLIFFIIIFGYILFFLFARSKSTLSAAEGLVLLFVFLFFILAQTTGIFLLSSVL